MKELLIALGLFFFIEGILYAIFPSKMKNMLKKLDVLQESQLRIGGLKGWCGWSAPACTFFWSWLAQSLLKIHFFGIKKLSARSSRCMNCFGLKTVKPPQICQTLIWILLKECQYYEALPDGHLMTNRSITFEPETEMRFFSY